ncbi:MAG: IS630 family transposase [Gloeobacteraceae cyanobacterium ES-bin-144]|nr:IS630 family transposase [Verrucomicrobiales bacterium]
MRRGTRHATTSGLALRIILLKADGMSDIRVAEQLHINRHTCRLWRQRMQADGPSGLWEAATAAGVKRRRVLPPKSLRRPCRHKPHRHKTFKLSRDANFIPKLVDVVGIYLSPPQNAVTLCVDEESQIQAWDRTQPGLPIKKGRCGTWTHDYVRNGTTTLFAALEVATGKVTGECYNRHRHQEFLKFLRKIDKEYGSEEQLLLVMDNYGTHKNAKVRTWLEKHSRFHLNCWKPP